ncbi:MAG: hypothetical protein CM15mP103_12400 [Gammaproteobacteria bacterium]|nr:MAG: hypothetical protein CM15mP103_12400 [Gammaproteobacteria bacterium]
MKCKAFGVGMSATVMAMNSNIEGMINVPIGDNVAIPAVGYNKGRGFGSTTRHPHSLLRSRGSIETQSATGAFFTNSPSVVNSTSNNDVGER